MSNLPPGVSDSMIPGNRPEDAAYERFVDSTWKVVEGFGIQYDGLSDDELERFDAICSDLFAFIQAALPEVESSASTCRHCGRDITLVNGRWIDPEATGDDAVWREVCDSHDTFDAEHEPHDGSAASCPGCGTDAYRNDLGHIECPTCQVTYR